MAVITFDVAAFRAQFPAFENENSYPDETLQVNWDTATCYISNEDYGYLRGDCRARAINAMTAHITALQTLIASGNAPSIVNSATIDKISVTSTPPPIKDQFQWWINLTPYGAQFLALLTMRSVGGFYVGGAPEKSAFRRVCGRF